MSLIKKLFNFIKNTSKTILKWIVYGIVGILIFGILVKINPVFYIIALMLIAVLIFMGFIKLIVFCIKRLGGAKETSYRNDSYDDEETPGQRYLNANQYTDAQKDPVGHYLHPDHFDEVGNRKKW